MKKKPSALPESTPTAGSICQGSRKTAVICEVARPHLNNSGWSALHLRSLLYASPLASGSFAATASLMPQLWQTFLSVWPSPTHLLTGNDPPLKQFFLALSCRDCSGVKRGQRYNGELFRTAAWAAIVAPKCVRRPASPAFLFVTFAFHTVLLH